MFIYIFMYSRSMYIFMYIFMYSRTWISGTLNDRQSRLSHIARCKGRRSKGANEAKEEDRRRSKGSRAAFEDGSRRPE